MKTSSIKPVALLLNDIHVSKDNLHEFHVNWREAVNICKVRNIPDMIIGGDLWLSRSSQTLSTLMAVKTAITYATNEGISLTIAEGNHCKVDLESYLGYSHLFSEYPDVYVVDEYTVLEFGDNLALYIMSYFPENGSFTDRLNNIIKTDFDKSAYNILYIHEGISGALATPNEKELPAKLFKDFNKVFVGHYHDRCVIKNTNIEYIGASRQHNFGEDAEKGYTILYSDGSHEFVKNQNNVRYRVIEVNFDEISQFLYNKLSQIADSFCKIKVKINCDSKQVSSIDKQKFIEAGATKVEIITEKTQVAEIENHSLEKKYDKGGIKKEYLNFCANKGVDVKMGLEYLDKID